MSALLPIEELVTGSFIRQRNTVISQMYNASLRCLKKMDLKKTEGEKKGTKTEKPRMLVLSKTGGSIRIYIYLRVNLGSSEKWRSQQ